MDYYTLTPGGLRIKDFDLKHTVESAQPLTFCADYNFSKGLVEYTAGKFLVKASFKGNEKGTSVRLQSDNIAFAKRDFVSRFRLNDDMKKIYSQISTDSFMISSIRRYHGMRITLNDPWETTLCFIISQYNNVKRIRLIIKRFISEFGQEIFDGDGKVIAKSFPTSEELIKFTEKDFRLCGAGFRAKYIASAADYCTNNLDLYKLKGRGYDKVKEELMKIHGVGDKVADCIALMGYGKMNAFPIDVWVKRTLEKVYFKGRDRRIKDLHKFADDMWGISAGFAQQYIFWGGRNL
ncbi:MAG: DNA-3-methyladenine glycosylase family protein [Candidatus Micrarchaeales archaeon]